MKKNIIQRIIGISMSIVLAVGVLPYSLGIRNVEADDGVTYNPSKVSANLIPAFAAANQQFMEDYVIKQRKGDIIYNSNAKFTVVDYKNIREDAKISKGKALSRNDLLMHDGNDDWYAEYKWDLSNYAVLKELIQSGQISINYDGYLASDEHRNAKNHWSKSWDRAVAAIKANGESYRLMKLYSECEQDEVGQHKQWSYTLAKNSQYSSLHFEATHSGCNCGSSQVGQSVIWLTDKTAPKITKVYAATDAEGQNKVATTKGFKAGQAGYIVLEFDEYIRFFNNESERLTLQLDQFSTVTDQEISGDKVTANLFKLEEKKMIFKFVVPEKLNGANTNIYISGISNTQNWAEQGNSAFSGCLISESGGKFLPDYLEIKGGSKISDLAGNVLDWENSVKGLDTTFFMDNVAPKLGSVVLTGNMISKDSTISRGEWPEDIDRSAVFAGVGDSLQFKIYFSEELDLKDISGISAKLNLKDQDGNQVKVAAEKIRSISAKSLQGVDTSSGNVTEIRFAALTMTEGMEPLEADGKAIQITSIEGLDGKKDLRGNLLHDMTAITMTAKQQEFLDVLAPEVHTSMTQTAGVYTPIVHNGREFTIPITIEDDKSADGGKGDYASDVLGLMGSFSLLMDGEAKEFSWCVDSSPVKAEGSYYRSGMTAAAAEDAEQYKLIQLNGNNTAYIHIRLEKDVDYNYADRAMVNATLLVNGLDYAGNTVTEELKLSHNADADSAEVTLVDYVTEALADGQATMEADFKVEDNFGISEVSYYWGEDSSNLTKADLGTAPVLSHEFKVEHTFSIATDDLRVGSKKITIIGMDVGGNPFSYTKELSYDLSRPTGSFEIETGSESAPIAKPDINIYKPNASNSNSRTLLFIETGEAEGNEKVYYVMANLGSNGYLTSSYSIFNFIPTYAGTSAHEDYRYAQAWYRVVGTIDETNNSGTFTSAEQIAETEVYKVGELVCDHYGTLNFIFVTTGNEFYKTQEELLADKFSFTNAQTTIEPKVVYLANDAEFALTVSDIRNEKGSSILSQLNYADGNGTRPAATLDQSVVYFNIENLSDEAANVTYGKDVIDFERSSYRFYCESPYNVLSGSLEEMMSQHFEVPEGFVRSEGYYRLQLDLRGVDGSYSTYTSEAFYIFPEAESVALSQYNKTLVRMDNGYASKLIKVREDSGLKNATELTIGLGENPEGWTTSSSDYEKAKHELVFSRNATVSEVVKTSNVQIKVWSTNDAVGETNAPWIDFSSATEIGYEPVLVTEFTKTAYGTETPVLPLTVGDNIVYYQVRNTNGTIETYEVLLHVDAGATNFVLHVEKEPTKAVVRAEVLSQAALSELNFEFVGLTDEEEDEQNGLKKYILDSSGTYEFVLYDASGNMTSQTCEIRDVDGIAPYSCGFGSDYDSYVNGDGFHFNFYAYDHGEISPEDITVTFDVDYSALLMGLEGEERANNTQQITMSLPVNMEADEDGRYIWQKFDSAYYGIYRTEIKEIQDSSAPGEAGYNVEVWGVFKYDDSIEDEYATVERSLTLTAHDKNGNAASSTRTNDYGNYKPSFSVGAMDPETGHVIYSQNALDENGELGIYTCSPVQSVDCYGAYEMKFDENLDWMSASYTSLPMITADGSYEIVYTDLFDTVHREELYVEGFSSYDVKFKVSEGERTNQDVIVTAMAQNDVVLKSMTGTIGETILQGNIDEMDSVSGSIIMPENGLVTVVATVTEEVWDDDLGDYTYITDDKTYTYNVRNIDKMIEPVTVVFQYNGSGEPEFVNGTTDTVSGIVKAVVVCSESLDGTNGMLSYEFPAGSKKGEEYTFKYKDTAGNTGEITAVLPYNITEDTEETPEVDVTAPEYTLDVLGKRNGEFVFMSNHNVLADGTELEEALANYIAQEYLFSFRIEDQSKTKLIVRESGSAAPNTYTAESAEIAGVTVAGTTITVKENTDFDIYVVDEANNVTALPSVHVTTVDREAPKVTVQSLARKANDGVTNIIRALYYPENDEVIYPYDSEVSALLETVQGEDYYTYDLMRYYQDFTDNGTYTFYYKDAYGNTGTAKVEIAGLDNAPPVIQAVTWYGTEENKLPEDSKMVNHNVTAELDVSKAIQDVKLYEYDAANEKGAEVEPETVGIQIDFTGKVAHIVFTANTEKAYVAEVTSNNDKTDSVVLPLIRCIDKTGPVISIQAEELSDDHTYKTFTFATNEAARMNLGTSAEDQMTHKWLVRKNGTYNLVFTDQTGNYTAYQVSVTGIDDVLLKLSYSKNADGSNAAEDALTLGVAAGETFYVMANKAATITWDDTETPVNAGVWTAFTVGQDAGYYAVKAKDAVTGRIVYGNVGAQFKDAVAPLIDFEEKTIYLKAGSTVSEMKAALESGVTVTDNRDKEAPAYQYSGEPTEVKEGIYIIHYTAADSVGNVGEASRVLYIYEGDKVLLKVNGSPIEPYGTRILSDSTVNLQVETESTGPVVMRWKSGIKTTGQMKYNSAKIDSTGILKVNEPGFYTIYVRTQNRAELIFYLFIEE